MFLVLVLWKYGSTAISNFFLQNGRLQKTIATFVRTLSELFSSFYIYDGRLFTQMYIQGFLRALLMNILERFTNFKMAHPNDV